MIYVENLVKVRPSIIPYFFRTKRDSPKKNTIAKEFNVTSQTVPVHSLCDVRTFIKKTRKSDDPFFRNDADKHIDQHEMKT